jgi:hypothetical protein
MEEEILKILESDDIYDPFSYGSVNQFEASKRIDTLTHEHYMKFVEWLRTNALLEIIDTSHGPEWMWEIFKGEDQYEYYTTEELYQYWLTNIEKI